ncbi:hypothetical protein V7146_15995 [Gottfriedia acidiceleris]
MEQVGMHPSLGISMNPDNGTLNAPILIGYMAVGLTTADWKQITN